MLEAHATELLAYLQSEGISTAGITFLPHTFEPFDLLGGRVEAISAYATDEPFLIQAAGEKYNVFTPRSSGIDFYGDTLFTTKQQLKSIPSGCKHSWMPL
jgi:ABC-type nitrate/sulfonate/bicarbonate transport system substrate-binding protein